MPDAVASVAALIVGSNWPKGSETGLRLLADAWGEGARQLHGLSGQLGASGSGVLDSVGGRIADEFREFVSEMETLVPGLADSAEQMSDLSGRTALQVEYAKAMIIVQSILVFLQILHFLLFALPEAVPVVVAGGRAIVTMLLKNLLVSVGSGVALNLVSDVLVQVGQFIAGHRHEWDKDATASAVESGAIGGAVGGVVFGAGRAWKPRSAESLLGKLAQGAVTGGVTEGITYGIWGDDTSAFGSAITAGVVGTLEGGRRFRFSGASRDGSIGVNTRVPHLPGVPDVGSGLTTGTETAATAMGQGADSGGSAGRSTGTGAGGDTGRGTGGGAGRDTGTGAGSGSGRRGTSAPGLTPGRPAYASAGRGQAGGPIGGTGAAARTSVADGTRAVRPGGTEARPAATGTAARARASLDHAGPETRPAAGATTAHPRAPLLVAAPAAPQTPPVSHRSTAGAGLTADGGLSGVTTVLRPLTAAGPATGTDAGPPADGRATTAAALPVRHTGTIPEDIAGSGAAAPGRGGEGPGRPLTDVEGTGSLARPTPDVRTETTPPPRQGGAEPSAVTRTHPASAGSPSPDGVASAVPSASAGPPHVPGSVGKAAPEAHRVADLPERPPRPASREPSGPRADRPAEALAGAADTPRPLVLELDLLDAVPGSDQIARIDALAAEVAHDARERDEAGRPLPDVTYHVHRPGALAGRPHFGRTLRSGTLWAERIRTVFERGLDAHLPGLAARLRSVVVLDPPGADVPGGAADADVPGRAADAGAPKAGRAVISVRDTPVPQDFLAWVDGHLGRLGTDGVPEERVRAAVQELARGRGAAFTRMDMKARAEATARHLGGLGFTGVRGGARTHAGPSSGLPGGPAGPSREGPSSPGGASGPHPPRAAADAPRPVTIGRDLEWRRPASIDRELPPPPEATGPVRFSDGSRLPAYLTGEEGTPLVLGAGRHEVRGTEAVVREVGDWLERHPGVRPAPGKGFDAGQGPPVLGLLRRALADDPREFIGAVKSLPYRTAGGRSLRLELTARPYGDPERFTFGLDNHTKIDTMQRFTQSGGRSRVNASSWGLGASTALGPAGGVSAGWFHGFFKAAFGRSARHTLQYQTVNQTETRSTDASHVHLDALGYEFRVTDRSGQPVDLNGGPAAGGGADRETAAGLRFAVRDGLALRLAHSLTAAASGTDADFPRTIELDGRARFHEVSVEDVVLVEPVLDRALTMMGIEPGAPGAAQIAGLLSPAGLRRSMRSLFMGPVTSPVLYGGEHGTDPLGVIRLEVIPHSLVRLGPATSAAEIRDIAQSAVRSERADGVSRGVEFGAAVGPGFHVSVPDGSALRLQVGLNARYGVSASRTDVLGSSAGIKVGAQKKGAPTGLYLVRQDLVLTGPAQVRGRSGAQPAAGDSGHRTLRKNQPQEQWSSTSRVGTVVRLSLDEARRLAGQEEPPPQGEAAPVPLLVTEGSLGVARVHEVSFPDGDPARGDRGPARPADFLADRVLSQLSHIYPDLVAPLAELYPGNPRWRGTEHFLTVLHNTREVSDRLSPQSMASNLGAMLDTGLLIGLDQWTPLGRRHIGVRVAATLTEREYLGRWTEQRGRFSAPGSDSIGGGRGSGRSWQVGVEGTVSLRDGAPGTAGMPSHAETASAGVRYGRRIESESGFAVSGGDEVTSITTGGADRYRYGVRFTVESGGHWRPRQWMRGALSGYLLGTQAFVATDRERTLIGPGARGDGRSGAVRGEAVRGEAVLSIPVAYTGTGGPALPAEPHRVDVMTTANARAMALGTREWLDGVAAEDTTASGPLPRSVLGFPHTTIDVTEGPHLLDMARMVLDRATGGSWQFRERGADGGRETDLPVQLDSRVANFGTTSAPLGERRTVRTAAPLRDRITRVAYRTRLLETADGDRPGLTALTPHPVKMEVEDAVSGSVNAWGRNSRTSNLDFGGRVNQLTSFKDTRVAGTLGLSLGARLSRTKAEFVQRSAAWTVNRKDVGGRQVVVSAPVEHTYAAASSRVGTGAHGPLVPDALSDAYGETRLSRWVGVVGHKAAYQLGVLRDGYGEVPRHDEVTWSELPWLRQVQFGGWPVNSPNPAGALSRIEARLRPLGLSDDDAERLRRLVSGRVVRALNNEMAGPGVALPARIGRRVSETIPVRVGSREVQLRIQLIPTGEPSFHGLDHSVELEEQVVATEAVQHSRGRTAGLGIGLTVAERADTGDAVVRAAGPVLSWAASVSRSAGVTQTDTAAFGSIVTHTDLHASSAQRHDVQIDLVISGSEDTAADASGGHTVREPGGHLHKHLPLSLMWTGPDPSGTHDPLAPAELDPLGATRRVPLPAATGAGGWHDIVHTGDEAGSRPFEMPAEGFAVRGFVGLEELHTANILALGAACDPALPLPRNVPIGDGLLARAQDTPLTRIGTGARESLEAGTSAMALTAFFPRTLTAEGYQVAGMEQHGVFGGVRGRLDLYSRPDLTRARLLTVADGVKFETPVQSAQGGASAFARSGSSELALDAGPAGPTTAGTALGGGGASALTAESDASGLSVDGLGSVNVKPDNGPRAYLFALPVTWLSVARAQHEVKDGAVMTAARGVFHLARREPPAMETDTMALAWVREDVARGLGLLTDTNHPAPATEAWDAVRRAGAALTATDKAHWDLRLGAGAERETALARARAHVAALEGRDVEALPAVGEARGTLETLLREQAEDDAEPAHEGWDGLRDALIEQARERLEQARRAAAAELAGARAAEAGAHASVAEVTGALRALHDHARVLHTELARLRRGADRLTAWHRLSADEQARLRGLGTGEPDAVVFTPPEAPVLPAAAPSKAPPKPAPSASPAVLAEAPAAGPHPAHATAPWQPRPVAGIAEDGLSFDAAGDHRTLTLTDTDGGQRVLDLHRPRVDEHGALLRPEADGSPARPGRPVDGNGFWAAVGLAGDRVERPGDLAVRAADAVPPGQDAHLDRRAVFDVAELETLAPDAFVRDPELRQRIRGAGGHLPEELSRELTPAQRRALLRTTLVTARRWDPRTAAEAAALAARTGRRDVIVVEEDGSHRHYATENADDSDARPPVIVHRRGDSYLAALPRRTEGPPADPRVPSAEARRRAIREGKRPAREHEPVGDRH
ncbi:WXG100-like domain-containing protein [Streptomyces sp. NPDC004324]